ncbi:MAG: glycosyltransferase family 39 protein [Gemmatimonadales bacterium]
MAALLIAALAVRIAYVEHTPFKAVNDAGTYNRLASQIARTGDYDTGSAPGTGAGGSRGPTAYFPPGFPYFLALVDVVSGHQAGHRAAIEPERIAQAVAGTIAVGLIGLVALEAFGASVALVSMALAAFYPVFVELSGTLVAENLLLLFELGGTWTMLRARRAQHPYAWIAATGVLTGLATLTHENAILFAIPFAFAAWAIGRERGPEPASPGRPSANRTRAGRRALAAPTILILITIVTIVPWTIRNASQLHHFVPVSDETGITLRGTYNPDSAGFGPVPYKWRFFWQIPQDAVLRHTAARYDEVGLGSRLQDRAVHYIGDHPLAPLDAAFHNTLRMFELEGSYAWHASAKAIGLHPDVAHTGVIAFWILCLLALVGGFTRAARAAPRWLWGLPLLYALSIVFVNVETPRFREPVDVFLVLLAGCAVSAALGRLLGGPSTLSRPEGPA